MHDITIKRVNRGWVVQVGCQTLVFTDPQEMVKAFSDYMRDRNEAERTWCDLNKVELCEVPPPTEPNYAIGQTRPGR